MRTRIQFFLKFVTIAVKLENILIRKSILRYTDTQKEKILRLQKLQWKFLANVKIAWIVNKDCICMKRQKLKTKFTSYSLLCSAAFLRIFVSVVLSLILWVGVFWSIQ